MRIQDAISACHKWWALEHTKIVLSSHYGNANSFAWTHVAVVTLRAGGEIIDWSAYMGGCNLTKRELDCVQWVAAKGNKLPRKTACFLFDYLPEELYRE